MTDLLHNRYELVDILGRGAMGVVWRAHDTVLRRHIALKELRPPASVDPAEALERFLVEAQAAARLSHPTIVGVHDVFSEGERVLIAMELIDGPTLDQALRARGPLSAADLRWVMGQIAHALSIAHHAGVVHRDLKPENVFWCDDGRVVVADFGLARIGAGRGTIEGTVMGTPGYMAPEQVVGGPVGPAADVFAWGTVAYELATGQPPFGPPDGTDSAALAYRIVHVEPAPLEIPDDPALAGLVAKAMAKDPGDRPSDGAGLKRELQLSVFPAATGHQGVEGSNGGKPSALPGHPPGAAGGEPVADGGNPASTTPAPAHPTVAPRPSGGRLHPGSRGPGSVPGPTADPASVQAQAGAAPDARPTSRAPSPSAPSQPGPIVGVGGGEDPVAASGAARPVGIPSGPESAPAGGRGAAISHRLRRTGAGVPTGALLTITSLVLVVLTFLVALNGAGVVGRAGSLPAGTVTVNGVDPADVTELTLDVRDPVFVAGKAEPGTVQRVALELSALGIPLGSAAGQAFQQADGTFAIRLDLSGARFFVAGRTTATLSLEGPPDPRSGIGQRTEQSFGLVSTHPAVRSLPVGILLILVLFLITYVKSSVYWLVYGQRRGFETINLLIGGAVTGFAAVLGAWLLDAPEPTVRVLVVCVSLGMMAGLTTSLAGFRSAQRREARRSRDGQEASG